MSNALCVAVVKGIRWVPPVDLHLTICSVDPGQDCPPCDLALVTLPVLQQAHSAFTAAKMLFVLLPDNASIRELWTLQRVVGFGRAADPLTLQEIQRVVEALHGRERRQETEQEGTVTIQESAVLLGSPFASHFRGEMRRFYQELQDLLLSIRPLEPTEFQHPFHGASPSQWLDFYGHRKSGAFLRPEAARETWEAIP